MVSMWKGAVVILLFSVLLVWLQYPRKVSQKEYDNQIKDKVVLLCGASSGIGEQLAYKLGAQGAKMLLVARTQSKLDKVKEGAIKAGAKRVETFSYDFSDVENSGKVVAKTIELFGKLDYLVLNHAAMVSAFLMNNDRHQDPKFISRMFRINALSFYELTFKALPHLESSKGHIFATSSMGGETPFSLGTIYSSTKFALNGFFYSLQQELLARKSPVGVTVGALGLIVTEDLSTLLSDNIDIFPEFSRGDVRECATGMMDSLVLRPRTFTYPVMANKLQRIMWYV